MCMEQTLLEDTTISGQKIVLISSSPIPHSNNITDGPGYRAWTLFQEIAKRHETVIISLYESYHKKLERELEVTEDNYLIKCMHHQPRRVARAVVEEAPDVIYLPWSSTPFISRLTEKIPTIVDYVGSGLLEYFVSYGYIPPSFLRLKIESFWLGDFLMTAGIREKYYLLGLLAASKRLSFRAQRLPMSLINVIPMSPPCNPPTLRRKVLEKDPNELIILVSGAFLPWYDYSTFFEALSLLIERKATNYRVIFLGGNPRDPIFERLVLKLGCDPRINNNLIFTGLVPFKERGNYYLSSDIGMNIPLPTVEDELSVRTRVIDYIWGGLPVVTPARDEYSKMVVENGGGLEYSPGNAHSLSQVIESLTNESGREKLERLKNKISHIYEESLRMQKELVKPLERFILDPFVDPARKSSRRYFPELLLLARDALRLLRP